MSSSKIVFKNTIFLYLRMFLVMAISLYTSRLVLQTLGVTDYGIYNIVGGFVTMFSFVHSAMTNATQRFLAFEIGKGHKEELAKVFSATLSIHLIIALVILICAETIGFWYINYKLNIPIERMSTVNWVYQFSVFSLIMGVIQVPYDALIVAHERMNIYAYVSIIEVMLKLFIVYLLIALEGDKLQIYAILTFLVTFIIRLTYQFYCRKTFKESKFRFEYDKNLFGKLLSYAGWSLFGNMAQLFRAQGNNILLNSFYGPNLNAAYGITTQLLSAVQMFVNNFQTAMNPQIVKSYSAGDIFNVRKLIFQSSKFSFLLVLLIVGPLILNLEPFLNIWLYSVPEYTIIFSKITLIMIVIEALSGPLITGMQATGNIKWYQIVVSIVIFLNLPIAYLFLNFSFSPEIVFQVGVGVSFVAYILRLLFLNYHIKIDFKEYFLSVFLRVIIMVIITYGISRLINAISFSIPIRILNVILESFLLDAVIVLLGVFILFSKKERNSMYKLITDKLFGRK